MFLIRDIEDIQKKSLINDSTMFDRMFSDSSRAELLADMATSQATSHLHTYSLMSTSDKEINLRTYPDEHVKKMIEDKQWTTPYPKPLMLNHDIYGEPLGRFTDAWYINHNDLSVEFGDSELPQEVLDEFVSRKSFDGGKGSTIGRIKIPSNDIKKKIIDGTYWTTSQGAMADSLSCNICDKPYWDCNHRRGDNYPTYSDDQKTVTGYVKCVPYTGALSAIEDSVVQRPANDTSTIIVFDSKAKKVVNLTNIADYNTLNIQGKNTDAEAPVVEENIPTNKEAGLTDAQVKEAQEKNKRKVINMDIRDGAKEVFQFKAQNKLNIKDSKKVNDFFDTLTDGELPVALKVIAVLADAEKEVIETPVAPVAPVVEETPVTTEAPVTNDEMRAEFKALQDTVAGLTAALQNVDGVNNKIPNVNDLTTENKEPVKKNSRFKLD